MPSLQKACGRRFPETSRRRRERGVRSSNRTRVDGARNGLVQCVKRPQRDRPKPDQEITSIECMPIFQRMHLKKAPA